MLKDFGKSLLLYGVASGISKFIGIFLIPVFTRYFSPEEYGSIDLIATIISFVSIIAMMQLESAIARYYYEVEANERKVYISSGFWAILIVSFLLGGLVMALSHYLSIAIFDSSQYSSVLKLAACNIVLLNLFSFLTVILRFENRPLLYATVIFIQFLTTLAVALILILYFNFGIKIFFISQITGLIAGSLILFICLRNSLAFHIDMKVLKKFFQYSIPQVPAVLGNWGNSYINRFIMLEQLTIHEIGIYTVALKIASVFNLVDNAFRMAWEPFIWQKIKKPQHQHLLRKISVYITIVVFFLSFFFILFSEELLFILSTSEYLGALPIIQILLYAFSFPILIHVFGIGTSIARKTIYNTLSFFIGAAVNTGLLLLFVPFFGLTGVPICLALSNMLILAIMLYFSERTYKIGFNYKKLILLTIIFTGLAFLTHVNQPDLIYRTLIATITVFFIIYYWKHIYSFIATKF